MNTTSDISVVGAGIAGLALARSLRRRGVSARVLERRALAVDAGLAINLPGNAVRALRALGLGDEIEAHGRAVVRREYRSATDRLLFAVDEASFWGPDLASRCLRRGDLLGLLEGDEPPGMILRDRDVLSAMEADECVEVGTRDGEIFAARLLVGADGVNSQVRRLRLGDVSPVSARLASSSWRFMVSDPGIACWTVWLGRDAMVLLIPVDRGEVYGWAALTQGEGQSESQPLRDAVRRFPALVRTAIDEALSTTGHIHHSPLEEVRLPRWSEGRTVLIGDAAHATAPVWAQGAALGLEDALVLSHLLAEGGDWSAAPGRYERLRRQRVEHVQRMTDRASRTAGMPSVLRNLLMPFLGRRSFGSACGPPRIPLFPVPDEAC